jgi:hypothetical protein
MTLWIRAGLVAGTFIFCAGVGGGCDDRGSSTVPPEVLAAANKPQQDAPKVPTTQELLSGHRSRTVLSPLPLTMELPPGWHQMKDAPVPNLWDGYTPSGEVQLQLNTRRPMTQEELDRLMEGARKEMAEKPQQILKVDLRPHGKCKILERQSVGQPKPFTLFDSNNVPHTTTDSIFNWTISLLAPGEEGAYQVYELNFIGLTKSQYDKDKDFLNSVVSTLQYGGDVSAGAATTAPSSPAMRAAPAATLP